MGKHDALEQETDPISVVTAPSATNLKAQQGIFTLLDPHHSKEAEGGYLPMEQVLEEIASRPEAEHRHKIIVGCKLQKFTLPVSEAGSLLQLLAKLDITPSFIYPGYQSIIRDIGFENIWR